MAVVEDLMRVVERAPRLDALPSRRESARGPRAQARGGLRAMRRSAVLMLVGVSDRAAARGVRPDGAGAVTADLDIVLTVRSATLSHHPGQVAFPGGGLEEADAGSPTSAALREAREEAGIETAGVEVLGALPEAALAASGNLVTPVLAWWAAPGAMHLDGTETNRAVRVPVSRLIDPAARCTWVLARDGATMRGPAFRVSGVPLVWGFTAALLDAVLDAAGWSVPWDIAREVRVEG